jgi:hypothetical protein
MSCLCTYDGADPLSTAQVRSSTQADKNCLSPVAEAEMNGPFKKSSGVPPPRRPAAVEHRPSSKRLHEDDEEDDPARGRRLEMVERENGAPRPDAGRSSLPLLTSRLI